MSTNASVLEEPQHIEQLKVSGNTEFSRGNLELALKYYTEALAIDTIDSSTRCMKARICGNRSLVHAKLGMLEESLQDASKCVSLDKSWAKGYLRLGMAFQALKQPGEALMSFELGASFLDCEETDEADKEKLAKEFAQHIARLQKKELTSTAGSVPTRTAATAQPTAQATATATINSIPLVTAARMAVTLRRSEEQEHGEGEGEGVANIAVRTLDTGTTGGGDNRGVFASRTLDARQVVLAVPRALMLTLQVAREGSSINRQLDIALHARPPLQLLSPNHCLLAIFMLQDRAAGPDHARFWSYYESLPRDLSSMPVFWTEEELSRLQGSWMLQRVEDRKLGILSDYSDIVRVAPEMAELASLQDFTAMRMLVNSRVFATDIDGVETMTMVPLVDMLNHRRPPQTEWRFDQATQSFQLTTTEAIAAGDELFDSYGAKCNSRYLLNYGFTTENNRDIDGSCHNEISFEVSLDPQDPCFKIKADMIAAGCSRREDADTQTSWRLSMSMHFETMTNLNSFCYARFILASSREMSYLPRAVPPRREGFTLPSATERGNIVKPISVANEMAVWQLFKEKALAQLAAFDTTLQHDYALRPSLTRLSNAWHACNLLIGEKEVCQYLIDVCEECCRLFALSWDEAWRRVQKRKEALLLQATGNEIEKEIVDYLEKICLPLIKKENAKHR